MNRYWTVPVHFIFFVTAAASLTAGVHVGTQISFGNPRDFCTTWYFIHPEWCIIAMVTGRRFTDKNFFCVMVCSTHVPWLYCESTSRIFFLLLCCYSILYCCCKRGKKGAHASHRAWYWLALFLVPNYLLGKAQWLENGQWGLGLEQKVLSMRLRGVGTLGCWVLESLGSTRLRQAMYFTNRLLGRYEGLWVRMGLLDMIMEKL